MDIHTILSRHLASPEKFLARIEVLNTMKIAIRTLAVALALTGAVASAHTRTADVKPTRATSIVPVPVCPPDDPNACGL